MRSAAASKQCHIKMWPSSHNCDNRFVEKKLDPAPQWYALSYHQNIVTEWPLGQRITFTDTTGATIKTAVNTKHFTAISRISFSQTSLSLHIHPLGPNPEATQTQHPTHRCTRQLRLCSVEITVSLVHTEYTPTLAATTLLLTSPRIYSLLAAGHWIIKHCLTSRMYSTLWWLNTLECTRCTVRSGGWIHWNVLSLSHMALCW